jgi:hypothetical protein
VKDAGSKGTARATVPALAALVGGVAAATAGAGACIADLPPDGASGASPTDAAASLPMPSCNNGFIDLDAGEQCDPGPSGDAGLAGCTARCQMECAGGFVWAGNNHCYRMASTTVETFDQTGGATDRCQALGAHVATFASEDEFQVVIQHFDAGAFWVGLQSTRPPEYSSVVMVEPGWSPTCPGCYAHTPDPTVDLPRVDAGVASMLSDDCISASTSADERSWREALCTSVPAVRAICEREPVGVLSAQCDGGVCIELVATFGRKRYVYVDQPASPDGAERACQAIGGRLVVLDSRDEREQLWRELSRLSVSVPPAVIWIGLALVTPDAGGQDGAAAQWIWDDGTLADAPDGHPPPWGDRQPHLTGTTTTRAYLENFMTPPFDNTLALNDGTPGAMPFVCELTDP